MTVRARHRLRLIGALSACAVLLGACGSSGKGLIPASNATSLQSDFDKLSSDVQSGNCAASQSDLRQAGGDLGALPVTVDAALRQRLNQGLVDLQQRAPTQCTQTRSSSSSSSSSSSTSSSSTTSSPTTSTTTSTSTTPPTVTSTATSTASPSATNPGGGVQAPSPGAGAGGAQGGNGQ